MEVSSSLNSGLQGFNNATETANRAAANIASQTLPHAQSATEPESPSPTQPSITESIVALQVAQTQAQASAHVIKTADEMLGAIIDVSV